MQISDVHMDYFVTNLFWTAVKYFKEFLDTSNWTLLLKQAFDYNFF